MGKNNLILGTGRGKLGDIVFYRTGGEQRFRTRVRPTNPRTNAQLLQRCVVSTAVKFYSTIVTVANHAFQNYEGSLKNHQRFMKLNIDYLRKVALRNIVSWSPIEFTANNKGNFTWKDSSDVAINAYQISEGDLESVGAQLIQGASGYRWAIGNGTDKEGGNYTYQDVVDMLGLQKGDQITIIISQPYTNSGYVEKTYIGRIILSPDNGDMTTAFSGANNTINQPNKENDGNITIGFTKQAETNTYFPIVIGQGNIDYRSAAVGIIVSRYENNKWRRSTSFMNVPEVTADLETLESAIESYQRADTSSLYLNQANSGNDQQNLVLYAQGEEKVIVSEEEKEETEKKKKRTNQE